jgi:hypothetical protein
VYFRSTRAFSLIAIAVGLGLTSIKASAQQATFHLPFEAHWGRAVLEPGDYKLSLPAGESPNHLIHLSGAGKGSMFVPQVTETMQLPLHRSYLRLVNVKGEYFVREYSYAPTNQVFTFGVPKVGRETTIASASTTSIPVEDARK